MTVSVLPVPLTVPIDVLPSPHVMTAVYEAAPPKGSALVNVATVPLKGRPPWR